MKLLKLILPFFIILSIVLVGIYACKKKKSSIKKTSQDIVESQQSLPQTEGQKGWFPKDSRTIEVKKKDRAIIKAPPEWDYAYESVDGNIGISHAAIIVITCGCLGGDGCCHPFLTPTDHCCVNEGCEGGCDKDTQTPAVIPQKDPANPKNDKNEQLKVAKGGFFNSKIGIKVVKDIESLRQLPVAFEVMFKIQEVQDSMTAFANRLIDENSFPKAEVVNGSLQAPENHKLAFLNVFGRATVVAIPNDDIPDRTIVAGSIDCECDKGSCTEEGSEKGGWWCDASDCDGNCSLIATIPDIGEVELKTYTL